MPKPRAEHLRSKDRIEHLSAAALSAAERYGFAAVTRDRIADHAGVSHALVTNKLGTMTEIRRRVMRAAIQHKSWRVLAEGLAVHDKCALRMPEDLKREVALWLAQQ